MDKISVIVPIYNVEKYLMANLESLINQTYSNLEIICVDDGSKDASGEIADEYAKKDERIKVIHKKNGGVSSARNVALDVMTGDFVAFADGDDIASIRQYEIMHDLIINNDADAAFCELNRFYDGDKIEKDSSEVKIEAWSASDALKNILMNKDVENYVTTKMFKAEFFEDVRFPEGKAYEDVATVYKIISKVKKVMHTNEKLYNYLVGRIGSISFTFSEKKFKDCMEIYGEQYRFLKERFPEIKDFICTEYVQSYLIVCEKMCLKNFYDLFDSEETLERYKDFCDAMNDVDKDFFESNLPPYIVLSSIILKHDRNYYKNMFDEIYKLKK